MTCTKYLAIIPARNISKFSKYHSPLCGSCYFGQFWNITHGITAKYHYKSCYYLYISKHWEVKHSTVPPFSHKPLGVWIADETFFLVFQLRHQSDATYYHFCDVLYNNVLQQINRLSERNLIIAKTIHHASHWEKKSKIYSGVMFSI